MATQIADPKSEIDLIAEQSNLQFPINYTGDKGLGLLVANILANRGPIQQISANQFISGEFPNIPDGFIQQPYLIPTFYQQNVLAGNDTITVIKPVNIYLIGYDFPLTSDFPLNVFVGSVSVGGKTIPVKWDGREITIIFNKSKGVGINGFSDINNSCYCDDAFRNSTQGVVTLRCDDYYSIRLVETNYNELLTKNWSSIKTAEKETLSGVINELYDLAFAGGAGPAGGDLTGNYPNPFIANGVISSFKLADGAVGTAKLANGAVGTAKLGDGVVTTDKIARLAVGMDQISDGSIISSKLASNSVTTGALVDSAVTYAKIGTGAVGTDKIGDGAVTFAKLGTESVGTAKIGSGAVTSDKIANKSIGSNKIVDGSIGGVQLADGEVSTAKLADGAVISQKIAANAVGTNQLDMPYKYLRQITVDTFVLGIDGTIKNVHTNRSARGIASATVQNDGTNIVWNVLMADATAYERIASIQVTPDMSGTWFCNATKNGNNTIQIKCVKHEALTSAGQIWVTIFYY